MKENFRNKGLLNSQVIVTVFDSSKQLPENTSVLVLKNTIVAYYVIKCILKKEYHMLCCEYIPSLYDFTLSFHGTPL